MKSLIVLIAVTLTSISAFAQNVNTIQRPVGLRISESELSKYINPTSFFDIRKGMFTKTLSVSTVRQDSITCPEQETITSVVLKVEGEYEYSITHVVSDKGSIGSQCAPEHSDSYTVNKSKIETLDTLFSELKDRNMNYELYIVNGDLKVFSEVIDQISNQNGFSLSSTGQLLFTLKTPLVRPYFLESGELRTYGISHLIKSPPNFPGQIPTEYETSSIQTQVDSGLNYPLETLREALKNVPFGDGDGPDRYKGVQDMTWLLN